MKRNFKWYIWFNSHYCVVTSTGIWSTVYMEWKHFLGAIPFIILKKFQMYTLIFWVLLLTLSNAFANFYSTGDFHIELVNTCNSKMLSLRSVFSPRLTFTPLGWYIISTTSTLSWGTESHIFLPTGYWELNYFKFNIVKYELSFLCTLFKKHSKTKMTFSLVHHFCESKK